MSKSMSAEGRLRTQAEERLQEGRITLARRAAGAEL